MSLESKRRCSAAIVGYGQTPAERRSSRPLGALAIEACDRAIADAGLRRADIDGICAGTMLPASGEHGQHDGIDIVTPGWIAEHMGLDARWSIAFPGLGQITGSVILAANAIASGSADYVLLLRALHNPAGRYHQNPATEAAGPAQWTMPFGYWGPPAMIALHYNEYLHRYGATREAMATLVVQLRKNVERVPSAYWHGKPLTVDDYLHSRILAEPISVLDCDIPVDGVSAFVLTRADRAGDRPHRPVYVAGAARAQARETQFFPVLDDLMAGGRVTAAALWKSAGLTHHDIDVRELYDGFTPLVYFWLECLGFCPEGEAHRFIQGGVIDPAGSFPLITGGGSVGNGRLHGAAQIAECYLQISRRAGERQLAKADAGIACHSFPNVGGAVVFTAEPV